MNGPHLRPILSRDITSENYTASDVTELQTDLCNLYINSRHVDVHVLILLHLIRRV